MTDIARVPSGIPTGGQFATQNRAEADISLDGAPTPERIETMIDEIVHGTETFSLTFVTYDDQLTNEQIVKYLAGEHDDVENEVYDVFSEQRYERAIEE